jgi:hypothetical protein
MILDINLNAIAFSPAPPLSVRRGKRNMLAPGIRRVDETHFIATEGGFGLWGFGGLGVVVLGFYITSNRSA